LALQAWTRRGKLETAMLEKALLSEFFFFGGILEHASG